MYSLPATRRNLHGDKSAQSRIFVRNIHHVLRDLVVTEVEIDLAYGDPDFVVSHTALQCVAEEQVDGRAWLEYGWSFDVYTWDKEDGLKTASDFLLYGDADRDVCVYDCR